MAAPCYIAWNAVASALTAPLAGTALVAATTKTVLQLKPGTPKVRIVEWGYSFTTSPTAPIAVELVETGTVFATVTQGSIANFNDVTGPASQAALGTAATGFNASAEGTITATRLLGRTDDVASLFKQQFPLGREPEVNGGSALRIRMNSPAVITALAYVIWEE